MVTRRTEDETQQLLRTVEMFEAITQSQADDYQSLEILRETYEKLGRGEESRNTSLKLAAALTNSGQISRAILEYEELLKSCPEDIVVRGRLAELQEQARLAAHPNETGVPPDTDSKPPPVAAIVTAANGAPPPSLPHGITGDEALARMLIAEKILTEQAAGPLLEKLTQRRPASIADGNTVTLLQLMVEEQLAQQDDLLSLIVTKSGKPFLPLSYYDVDREVGYLLPKDLCFERCVVPFDLIGRSVLVATANPFDQKTVAYVKQMLDYSLFWYVSPPQDILAALRKVHGIEGRKAAAGARS